MTELFTRFFATSFMKGEGAGGEDEEDGDDEDEDEYEGGEGAEEAEEGGERGGQMTGGGRAGAQLIDENHAKLVECIESRSTAENRAARLQALEDGLARATEFLRHREEEEEAEGAEGAEGTESEPEPEAERGAGGDGEEEGARGLGEGVAAADEEVEDVEEDAEGVAGAVEQESPEDEDETILDKNVIQVAFRVKQPDLGRAQRGEIDEENFYKPLDEVIARQAALAGASQLERDRTGFTYAQKERVVRDLLKQQLYLNDRSVVVDAFDEASVYLIAGTYVYLGAELRKDAAALQSSAAVQRIVRALEGDKHVGTLLWKLAQQDNNRDDTS